MTVRVEPFEGPLDLLLYLIQNRELDISVVSISKITDQYLRTIRLMQDLNFDVASEFLLMAATLILWKSKAILPFSDEDQAEGALQDDDILTPEELMRQLLEHQRFLAAGDELAQFPRLGEDTFVRSNRKAPVERIWREMNITGLTLSYQDSLVRERKRKQVLKKETVSLSEKIQTFHNKLSLGKITPFLELLEDRHSRPENVVTFLASLELSRLRKLKLYQNLVYDPIFLELIETLANFDLSLASGFNAERTEQEKSHEEEAIIR